MDSAAYVVRIQVLAAPLDLWILSAVYWHRLMRALHGGGLEAAVTFNIPRQESIQGKDMACLSLDIFIRVANVFPEVIQCFYVLF